MVTDMRLVYTDAMRMSARPIASPRARGTALPSCRYFCVVEPVAAPGGTYANNYKFTVVATNSFGKGKAAKASGSG